MKNGTALLLCGLLLSTPVLAAAPPGNNDPAEAKQVMAALEAMAQATIKRDVAALEKIYRDDLTYSHSDSRTQTKAEVLKDAVGPRVFESMSFKDPNIRIYGSVAIVKGVNLMRSGIGGKMNDIALNILWVLVKGPQGWQIAARQSTAIAARAAAPTPR